MLNGRHFVPGPPIEDRHLCAHPQGGHGRIDGRVPAADHHHLLADLYLLAGIGFVEKFRTVHDIGGIFSGNIHVPPGVGADRKIDGLVVFLEIFKGNILPDLGAVLDLHTQVCNFLDLGIENIIGEPVDGDPETKHAAALAEHLKDRHRIALPGQLIGTG